MQSAPFIHDLIGIGFGPSNLAIAVALRDSLRTRDSPFSYCFLEKQPRFLWHGDMMLDSSRMQISFLKDLATLRDPSSPYTFINYLHAKNRLVDFINLKTFFPSRHEFNDYLQWVAGHFSDCCHYGEEVISIEPHMHQGEIKYLGIRTRSDAGVRDRLARHIVVGMGGSAKIPKAFQALKESRRLFHTSNYLSSIENLQVVNRIAVIGAGQSAVEIFLDLNARFPRASIDLICRASALKPSDDSPFANEIFNPEFVDYIFHQPLSTRKHLLTEFESTNYSAGDIDLIEEIYRVFYQQKVRNDRRHRFLRRHDVLAATVTDDCVELQLQQSDLGERSLNRYDAVVLATGYQRDDHEKLLAPLSGYIGNYSVQRNYRLDTDERCRPAIFLQGCCEESHGLSDTLLSILPIRAQEVVESLLANNSSRTESGAFAPMPEFAGSGVS